VLWPAALVVIGVGGPMGLEGGTAVPAGGAAGVGAGAVVCAGGGGAGVLARWAAAQLAQPTNTVSRRSRFAMGFTSSQSHIAVVPILQSYFVKSQTLRQEPLSGKSGSQALRWILAQ